MRSGVLNFELVKLLAVTIAIELAVSMIDQV